MSSWLIRLAQVNGERLSFVSHYVSQNHNFWKHDPDKFLNPDVLANLEKATGLPASALELMQLGRYEGLLCPQMLSRATGRWVLPLAKRFYQNQRLGALYCPECLQEGRKADPQASAPPYVRLNWRLSFMVACPEHGRLLRDCCPHCQAPFAPHLNDVGRGKNWLDETAPFGWCPNCGEDVRVRTEEATPADLAFQGRLLTALESGVMDWEGVGEVPALEGFDVFYKLLGLLTLEGVQKAVQDLSGLPGPVEWPERSNRSFEDFTLQDRRLLLRQVAFLASDWPETLVKVAGLASLTRKPLVVNMTDVPLWYDVVADRFSLANGRRPYKNIPLVEHVSRPSLMNYRTHARSESERRRWDILWHYHAEPNATLVARKLGVRWDLVARTVARYNAEGPDAIRDPRQGRVNRKKRLLSEEQEQELRAYLRACEKAENPPSNEALADWFEARVGVRPDSTTLWIYRRGMKDHSVKGRRAGRK